MRIIGHNIISALGFSSQENYSAVKTGQSGLCLHDKWGLQEPFMASLIDRDRVRCEFKKICEGKNDASFTDWENASVLSVILANQEAGINLSSPRVVFIVSTTKGNVGLLDGLGENDIDPQSPIYLWKGAASIVSFFGNPNMPVVVSNACISGGAALITANRLLKSGKYDYAVVVGCDILNKFIISGFQSFKALSTDICKPFDINRCGLNLGEAAATVILAAHAVEVPTVRTRGKLVTGALCNDACHISAPSRTAEGSYEVLRRVLEEVQREDIAFINAHGTATPYNDSMELKALARNGLHDVPINSLKPFFGHTLGAAGIVESIVSLLALHEGIVLRTLGLNQCEIAEWDGKTYTPNICTENQSTQKKYCIKMLSGFGGTNAALLWERGEE